MKDIPAEVNMFQWGNEIIGEWESMEKILEMKRIYKAFPGVIAVNQVDLQLHKGEVLALMGENGAGKSTLIKILSGMYTPDEGEIVIDGKKYLSLNAREALEAGVAVIYQELNYLNDLTIAENILLGQIPLKGVLRKVDYKKMYADVQEIMEQVGLGHRKPTQLSGELSVAEKQLIEIARAFSRNVKILVMDEPTSALNETETEKLFQLIERLKKQGIGIIYISHRMEEIFRIADRVQVMRDGKYITQKPIGEVDRDALISYMVGRTVKELYPKRNCKIGTEILKVNELTTKYLKKLSFHIKAGEVVGFFGLMGAGRSEMARCVIGTQKATVLNMEMDGKQIVNHNPKEALDHGMTYVPAERKTEGVNLVMSVKENITLANLKDIKKHHILNQKIEKTVAKEWVEKLNVKTPSLETEAGNLSGGNQQKLVIAKCLNTNPHFLMLNEPTRGIDVGAKAEIYDLINEMCRQQKAILLISSELPEIMAMSDRIYVMCEGKITGEVEKKDFSQEILMKLAIGEGEYE